MRELRETVTNLQVLLNIPPSASSSKLYPALGSNARLEWMLHLSHFGNKIGGFDESGRSVSAGDDDVQRRLRGADGTKLFEDFC